MSFSGWPEEALEFYEGLAADNTKTYWTKHKEVYDANSYAELCEAAGADPNSRQGYFPAYRGK